MTELKIGKPSIPLSSVRTRELYSRNSWATRSAPEKQFGIKSMQMDDADFTSGFHYNSGRIRGAREPEWSFATTFARGGIEPGQGLKGTYSRDPHTGVWHKVISAKPWFRENGVMGPTSNSGGKAGSWGLMRPPLDQMPAPILGTRDKVNTLVPMNNLSVSLKRQPL